MKLSFMEEYLVKEENECWNVVYILLVRICSLEYGCNNLRKGVGFFWYIGVVFKFCVYMCLVYRKILFRFVVAGLGIWFVVLNVKWKCAVFCLKIIKSCKLLILEY